MLDSAGRVLIPKVKVTYMHVQDVGWFIPLEDITTIELALFTSLFFQMILPKNPPALLDAKGFIEEHGLIRHFQEQVPQFETDKNAEKSQNN